MNPLGWSYVKSTINNKRRPAYLKTFDEYCGNVSLPSTYTHTQHHKMLKQIVLDSMICSVAYCIFIFGTHITEVESYLKRNAKYKIKPQNGHTLNEISSTLMQCAIQMISNGDLYGKLTSVNDPSTCSVWHDRGGTFMDYYRDSTAYWDSLGNDASYLAREIDAVEPIIPAVFL